MHDQNNVENDMASGVSLDIGEGEVTRNLGVRTDDAGEPAEGALFAGVYLGKVDRVD